MKTSFCLMIFCLTFCDIWDLSTSQNSRNESDTHIKAPGVTLTASNVSSHESITHTTTLIRTPFTTTGSQNTPRPTSVGSASCSQVHVGSFLGGMMLGFITALAVPLGYRLTCSRQQGRYRALEQHDAII